MSYYKRFIVFRWDHYYPSGGFRDYVGDADTLNEALALLPKNLPNDQEAQIIDLETGESKYNC